MTSESVETSEIPVTSESVETSEIPVTSESVGFSGDQEVSEADITSQSFTDHVVGLKTVVAKGPMAIETAVESVGANLDTNPESEAAAETSEVQLQTTAEEQAQALSSDSSPQEMSSEESFPNMKQDFDTVRVVPSQNQSIETIQVQQQEAETVRVLPTELGLPTLAPQDDNEDFGGQDLDDPQTVRIMPSLSQESENQEEGPQDEVAIADSDTLQTKEEQPVHDLEPAQDLLSYQPRETETQISPIGQIEMSSVTDVEKNEDAKDDEQDS